MGLVARLVLAFAPGHSYDIFTFTAWADSLAKHGAWGVADAPKPPDYLPGYLYVLWLFGELRAWLGISDGVFAYMLKVPGIAADMASAVLLYALLKDLPERRRMTAVLIYLALPPVLFVGALWGQVDSILSLLLLLTIYFLGRKRLTAAAVTYAVAFVVKPQAMAAFPAFVIWAWRDYPWREVWRACAIAGVVGFALILPFFPTNPLEVVRQLARMSDEYQYNGLHVFNFWSMDGWRIPDGKITLGADWRTWALLLTIMAYIPILRAIARARGTAALALGVAACVLVFYTFQTRMHERYLFSALLPMLAACAMYNDRRLWTAFAALSTFQFVALCWAYGDVITPGAFARALDWSPPGWRLDVSLVVYALSVIGTAISLALMTLTVSLLRKPRESNVPS